MIQRTTQLRVLCLKFCPSVCSDTLAIIAEEANPFYLRELYLDGCDKINDQAIANLVQKKTKEYKQPEVASYFSQDGSLYIHDFNSIVTTHEEMVQTIQDIGVGGAHGLEIISLAECKNINDVGITQ